MSVGGVLVALLSTLLLFCLVLGMSATVNVRHLTVQIQNYKALLIGVSLQFFLLPLTGFLVVKALRLDSVVGIILLVITSSPGGSYSNWWCSMFNAELALSVTMTALSTLLSVVMLPINLLLYTKWTYSADVVQSVDWTALFITIITVVTGIATGVIASSWVEKRGENVVLFHKRANLLGNLAGLALITLSITVSSSNQDAALWDQDVSFYIGVALPAVIGMSLAVYLATRLELAKPERVAVTVESCYQNTGIATSVALTMFHTETDRATAIGVPLYYGIVEAVMLGTFCIVCWKTGWTKAPPNENFCRMIANSYEVEEMKPQEEEVAIEVVLGCNDHVPGDDLVFQQTDQGAYIVDEKSLQNVLDKNVPPRKHSDEPTENDDSSIHSEDGSPHGMRPSRRRPYAALWMSYTSQPEAPQVDPPVHDDDNDAITDISSHTSSRVGRTVARIKALAVGYRTPPAMPCDLEQELPPCETPRGSEQPTMPPLSPDDDCEAPTSTYGSSYQSVPSLSPDARIDSTISPRRELD